MAHAFGKVHSFYCRWLCNSQYFGLLVVFLDHPLTCPCSSCLVLTCSVMSRLTHSDVCAEKIPLVWIGGRASSVHRYRSEDPPSAPAEILFTYMSYVTFISFSTFMACIDFRNVMGCITCMTFKTCMTCMTSMTCRST